MNDLIDVFVEGFIRTVAKECCHIDLILEQGLLLIVTERELLDAFGSAQCL